MSQKLVDRNPDLKRLRDEGYVVSIVNGGLLVEDIPYVGPDRKIRRGTIISTLELQQDLTTSPKDHTVIFVGDELPCNQDGTQLEIINTVAPLATPIPSVVGICQFSSKPTGGYPDYYAKITTYVKIVLHQAQAIDPRLKAKTFRAIRADDGDDSPFKYHDTSSSRAGIGGLNQKLAMAKVAIVGLGGTGSYILDFVAKTHVKEIHLFDDDEFRQHNAFRCPGALAFEELTEELTKIGYYEALYSKLRNGVIPHAYRIDAGNAKELAEMDFVFLCLDTGELKDGIMRVLEEANVPFIDVGMGMELGDDMLSGLIRITTSTPEKREHVRDNGRVSFARATGDNIYSRNIQVVELNAMNASLAVIRWKKYCGFYLDLKHEHQTVYAISTNRMSNEDHS